MQLLSKALNTFMLEFHFRDENIVFRKIFSYSTEFFKATRSIFRDNLSILKALLIYSISLFLKMVPFWAKIDIIEYFYNYCYDPNVNMSEPELIYTSNL